MPKSEQQQLCEAVDVFAAQMKRVLIQKLGEGFEGWDDPNEEADIADRMFSQACLDDPNYVHVANFAMMLWRFQEGHIDAAHRPPPKD